MHIYQVSRTYPHTWEILIFSKSGLEILQFKFPLQNRSKLQREVLREEQFLTTASVTRLGKEYLMFTVGGYNYNNIHHFLVLLFLRII